MWLAQDNEEVKPSTQDVDNETFKDFLLVSLSQEVTGAIGSQYEVTIYLELRRAQGQASCSMPLPHVLTCR